MQHAMHGVVRKGETSNFFIIFYYNMCFEVCVMEADPD